MAKQQTASQVPPPRRPPFQFSVATALVVITFAAVGCWLATYLGPGLIWPIVLIPLTLVSVAQPVCFGTLAIYCHGYRRTFFLGAFAGALFSLVGSTQGGSYATVLRLVVGALGCLVTALSCGLVAVATRRFAERRDWHLPKRNLP